MTSKKTLNIIFVVGGSSEEVPLGSGSRNLALYKTKKPKSFDLGFFCGVEGSNRAPTFCFV